MDKLKSIIREWELAGKCLKVPVKPRCVNLLTMLIQSNPVTGEVMSWHVNIYMIVPHTKLQDLHTLEPCYTDIFQTSLDLTSMFPHVLLHESMYNFFGFALDFDGVIQNYVFMILQFGNAYCLCSVLCH